MNKFYLYINKEDELGEIIAKIREISEKNIIIVVPEKTKALSHKINLELLKKEIENLNKNVFLNTEDEKIKVLAKEVGLQIFLDEIEEKIFDIKPPSKSKRILKEEEEKNIKELEDSKFKDENLIENIKQEKYFSLSDFFSFLKFDTLFKFLNYTFLILFIFLLGFIFLNFFQSKADIIIELQKIPYEIDEIITLKESELKPDNQNKILPAKFVNIEVFGTEIVTTTGETTESQPLLKVNFLNYSNLDIVLIQGTRLSYGKNIFKTTEKIVIPKALNNKPGEKEVLAIPTVLENFDLKIEKGTELKVMSWEEKKTKLDDGTLLSEVVKVFVKEDYASDKIVSLRTVTSDDISKAKLNLEENLKKSVLNQLSFKYKDYFYVYEPLLVKTEILNVSHNVGDKIDKITVTGKANYETMIVKKQEFDDFIKSLINKDILENGKDLRINDLKVEKLEILDFDSKKKFMTIGLKAKATLVSDIKETTLKENLKGKKIEEAVSYIKEKILGNITINIFPSWKDKLPDNSSQINIILK
jgi:hypothetical protein